MRSIINEKNLNNKKILLRLDLNVPLERDKITDTTRIDKILPTLNFLIKEKAKIIILSHVGRPKGKIVKELSLKPICEELQNKLKNILEVTHEKLVSIDFNHHPASAIVDASLTNVVGSNMGKISAWYDNEWGFSNRMCDIAETLHKIS